MTPEARGEKSKPEESEFTLKNLSNLDVTETDKAMEDVAKVEKERVQEENETPETRGEKSEPEGSEFTLKNLSNLGVTDTDRAMEDVANVEKERVQEESETTEIDDDYLKENLIEKKFADPKRQARMERMAARVDKKMAEEDKEEEEQEKARQMIKKMDGALNQDAKTPSPSKNLDAQAERQDDEAILRGKYRIDPEEVAVSGWKKFKLGFRSLFSPKLKKTWRSYQENLKAEEAENIAERPLDTRKIHPKSRRRATAASKDVKITGPNRFGL